MRAACHRVMDIIELRVAFINTLYTPNEIGGAERAVKIIAERNAAGGGTSVVITLAKDGVARTDSINGVTVYYVPLANVGFLHNNRPLSKWRRVVWHAIDSFNPLMMLRVYRILRAERPDIVEANNLQGFSVSAWAAARLLNLPIVQVLHDYYLGCANSSMYRNGRNCVTQCVSCRALCTPRRLLNGLPDAVSSVSRRTLKRLNNHGMFERTRLVLITPTALRLADIRAETIRGDRQAGDVLVLGFFGRIEPVKGVETLLAMLDHLPDLEIQVVVGGQGDAEYIAYLKDKYRDSRATFLGFVEPMEFYGAIDALVVPSIWEEPLTRVIAEAQTNGLPAIVSRIGGLPEAIEDGVTGLTFEPGDDAALAEIIRSLHGQDFPTPAMRIACRQNAERYTADTVYGKHAELWRKAIDA